MLAGIVLFFLFRFRALRRISCRLEEEVRERTQSLRRAKENLSITLNSIGDAVVRTDENGRVRFMNPVGRGILTGDASDPGDCRVEELGRVVDVNSGEALEHPVYTVLDSKEELEGKDPVKLVRTGDGEEFVVSFSVSPLTSEDGKSMGSVFVFRDITEKHAREEALRQSESMFRTFAESLDVAIMIYRNARWIYANPAAEEITGYSQSELMQMDCWDVVHPDYRESVRNRVRAREKKEEVEDRYSLKVLSRKGEERVVDFQARSIHFHGQSAILVTARDITERLEEEKQKDKLQKQLRQAQRMEAVGTLAGGIAHDFNNLLQGMSGQVEYLFKKCEQSGLQDNLQDLQNLVERATDLVRRLLMFSRKTEAEKKEVSMRRVMEDALQILRRTIPKMIRLNVEMDDWKETMVFGDSGQLEQVAINLIKNAVDALGETGGDISISCERSTLSKMDTLSRRFPAGDYIILSVSDTGCGMDEETQEQIFDPFFTTKEAGKGTGLGLATVYGIVTDHDGDITCYSNPGRGTTFRVYLPALERGGNSEESSETEAELDLSGDEGVLLVDDEELILDVTSDMLKDSGYRVYTAQCGEEAIEVYKESPGEIDVAIVDLGMPGMGGEQCLSELLGIDPELKVIVASGYLEHSIKKDPGKYGARSFIGKPYRMDRLLRTLREIIESS